MRYPFRKIGFALIPHCRARQLTDRTPDCPTRVPMTRRTYKGPRGPCRPGLECRRRQRLSRPRYGCCPLPLATTTTAIHRRIKRLCLSFSLSLAFNLVVLVALLRKVYCKVETRPRAASFGCSLLALSLSCACSPPSAPPRRTKEFSSFVFYSPPPVRCP